MNTMDDLYPGCANGRRLDVVRAMERILLDQYYGKLDATSDNGGTYPGCFAADQTNYQLIKRQLEEMETNRSETGFAVTDHELKDAIVLGVYSTRKRSMAVGKFDWRLDGF